MKIHKNNKKIAVLGATFAVVAAGAFVVPKISLATPVAFDGVGLSDDFTQYIRNTYHTGQSTTVDVSNRTSLDLSGKKVTAKDLKFISDNYSNLQTLNLSNTGIDDSAITEINKLTKLTSLDISNNNIKTGTLAALTKLASLNLNGNPINATGITLPTIAGKNINVYLQNIISKLGDADEGKTWVLQNGSSTINDSQSKQFVKINVASGATIKSAAVANAVSIKFEKGTGNIVGGGVTFKDLSTLSSTITPLNASTVVNFPTDVATKANDAAVIEGDNSAYYTVSQYKLTGSNGKSITVKANYSQADATAAFKANGWLNGENQTITVQPIVELKDNAGRKHVTSASDLVKDSIFKTTNTVDLGVTKTYGVTFGDIAKLVNEKIGNDKGFKFVTRNSADLFVPKTTTSEEDTVTVKGYLLMDKDADLYSTTEDNNNFTATFKLKQKDVNVELAKDGYVAKAKASATKLGDLDINFPDYIKLSDVSKELGSADELKAGKTLAGIEVVVTTPANMDKDYKYVLKEGADTTTKITIIGEDEKLPEAPKTAEVEKAEAEKDAEDAKKDAEDAKKDAEDAKKDDTTKNEAGKDQTSPVKKGDVVEDKDTPAKTDAEKAAEAKKAEEKKAASLADTGENQGVAIFAGVSTLIAGAFAALRKRL